MLACFMIKLEITFDIGPVGDLMHIQEGRLPFVQNGDSYTSYLRTQHTQCGRWGSGSGGKCL